MRRAIRVTAMSCGLSLALAGCVSLKVEPAAQAGREGIEYRLPFTQFKGTQIRRLAECGPMPKLAIKLDSVTVVSSPDWTRRYAIDMHSLSSAFKASALKVERYPNGQLKAINAEADDRSAAVLAVAFSTAMKVVAPTTMLAGADESKSGCTLEAISALEKASSTKIALQAKTAEVAEQTSRLNGLLERLALAGGTADDGLRRQLAVASKRLQDLRAEHVALQVVLDNALKQITLSEEFVWPARPSELGPALNPLPTNIASKWFVPDRVEALRRLMCTQFSLEPNGTAAPHAILHEEQDAELKGIRYRESEPGAFVVRLAPEPAPNLDPNAEVVECSLVQGDEEFRMSAEIHQFGSVRTLPFTNRMFQKNTLAATWDEAGRLTMVSYGVQSSSAEAVTKLLSESVDSYRGMQAERLGQETAELKAQNELLSARIANAELMDKIDGRQNPDLEQLANFDADRRLAEAETAAINAEIALDRARLQRAGVP